MSYLLPRRVCSVP